MATDTTGDDMERVTMDSTVKCPNCETLACPLVISETGTVHFNRCRVCGTDWTMSAATGDYTGWNVPANPDDNSDGHYIGLSVDERGRVTSVASPDESALLTMGLTVSRCSCDAASFRDCTEVDALQVTQL